LNWNWTEYKSEAIPLFQLTRYYFFVSLFLWYVQTAYQMSLPALNSKHLRPDRFFFCCMFAADTVNIGLLWKKSSSRIR
jgi:hypothetical protein